jgi:parallel beta-helix repeat protein
MKQRIIYKGFAISIILLFVGAGVIPSTVGNIEKKGGITGNTASGYIQGLIDNASEGDTIYIPVGIYYENIIINKSICLIGEDMNTTIIDGGNEDNVVYISADWVNIRGFTIQKSGYILNGGIKIDSADYTTISGNAILNNLDFGIYLTYSNGNIITYNNISSNNNGGIYLQGSSGNIISGNTINSNRHHGGIYFTHSSSNIISGNIIILNSGRGLKLEDESSGNTIADNTISSNNAGIFLGTSSNCNTLTGNIISSNNYYGIKLMDSNRNTISDNSILNTGLGINLISHSSGNIIKGNNISNNEEGISLEDTHDSIGIKFNLILKNNFFDNENDVFFTFCRTLNLLWWTNRFILNYWNRLRIFPKPIIGELWHYDGHIQIVTIPWIRFDWRPVLKPYDI